MTRRTHMGVCSQTCSSSASGRISNMSEHAMFETVTRAPSETLQESWTMLAKHVAPDAPAGLPLCRAPSPVHREQSTSSLATSEGDRLSLLRPCELCDSKPLAGECIQAKRRSRLEVRHTLMGKWMVPSSSISASPVGSGSTVIQSIGCMAAPVRRVSTYASDAACTAPSRTSPGCHHSPIQHCTHCAGCHIILAFQVCIWVDISRQGLPALQEAWLARTAQNTAAGYS